MKPKKISKDSDSLIITWENGDTGSIKLADLRFKCPCAFCLEERKEKGEKYIPLYNSREISITGLQVVGNYAVNIIWQDGHNSGIYNFDYLKEITAN